MSDALVWTQLPNGEFAYLRPERTRRVSTDNPDFSLASPSVEARALAMLSRYLADVPKTACPACDGSGAENVQLPCELCGGTGVAPDVVYAFLAAYRAGYRAGRKDTFEACANLAAVTDQFERATERVEKLIRDAAA